MTKKEYIELKWSANYWKAQHGRAIEREAVLKEKLKQSQAQIRDLNQRLYGKKSERSKGKSAVSSTTREGSQRRRGQQKRRKGHGRTQRADLPVFEEIHLKCFPKMKKNCLKPCRVAFQRYLSMEKPENSRFENSGPPCCASTQASRIVDLTSTIGFETREA